MPTPAKPNTDANTVVIKPIQSESIVVSVLGTRPLIINRLSEKVRRELMLPSAKKTASDKAANLKHDPIEEFLASPYTLEDDNAPTYLALTPQHFKGAMMNAALDLPEVRKTQVGRLVWVEGETMPIYGIPELFIKPTRMADMARTPDVKARCIIPNWAAEITITFTVPLMTKQSVVNLLAAAGMIAGVGDWRPEKGKGTYGQFSLVDDDDPRFVAIKADGGRAAQIAAMADPECYDAETQELLGWFTEEVARRGRSSQLTSVPKTKERAA